MIRLLADENLNRDIVRGVQRRVESVDFIRAQEAGLAGRDDPALIAWAAQQDRIIVTHDVSTLLGFAFARIDQGGTLPGIIAVPQALALAAVIEDLTVIVGCGVPEDFRDQVRYLPLR